MAPMRSRRSTGIAELAVPVQGVRATRSPTTGATRATTACARITAPISWRPAARRSLAAAPGTIEKLFESAAGGTTLYVRSPRRRWTYYYAHLAGYAPGLA